MPKDLETGREMVCYIDALNFLYKKGVTDRDKALDIVNYWRNECDHNGYVYVADILTLNDGSLNA